MKNSKRGRRLIFNQILENVIVENISALWGWNLLRLNSLFFDHQEANLTNELQFGTRVETKCFSQK